MKEESKRALHKLAMEKKKKAAEKLKGQRPYCPSTYKKNLIN